MFCERAAKARDPEEPKTEGAVTITHVVAVAFTNPKFH